MKKVLVVIALAAVGYGLYAIWPTPYSIEKVGKATVRKNRITGERQILMNTGWKEIKDDPDINVRPGDRYGEDSGIKNAVQ